MKKLFFLVLVFILSFGIDAMAEKLYCEKGELFEAPKVTESDETELLELNSNEISARDALARGMKNMQSKVTISFARVKVNRIFAVVNAAYLENPELYYVHDEYYYWYTGTKESGYITSIDFTYLYTKDQVKEFDKVIENEKQHVLSMMDESMTDLEKVMLVHNYIVMNHEYDYTYTIYNIYDFFTQRTGVCQAYALAMTYFLRAAGVGCVHAYSYDMNHDWNLVEVDGMWYHVDATWNDTINESNSSCFYTYFLKSDEEFLNLSHYGWDSEHEAVSAWYDDYYFKNYRSPFWYYKGLWYVLKNGNIYKIDNLKYGGEELWLESGATFDGGWGPAYDMTFALYGNSFIYNTSDGIYAVNPSGNRKPRKIAEMNYFDYEIYEFYIEGHTLFYKAGRYADEANALFMLNLDEFVSFDWFEINNVVAEEGTLHLDYKYDSFYEGIWKLYVAAYDANNVMLDVWEVTPGKYTVVVPKADRYEAFIWEGCMPLCDSLSTK